VDGWSGTLAPGGAYDDYTVNSCGTGGALVAALGDQTAHLAQTDRATWAFTAPTFARIASVSLARSGSTAGGSTGNATYQFWLSSPKLSSAFDQCVASVGCKSEGVFEQPFSPGNYVGVPTEKLGSQLLLSAGCGGAAEPEPFECPAGQGDPNNYAAAIYLYAADLTLEQTAGPNVTNVGGELATASAIAGTTDLTFTATDPGAGVYEAEMSVDGTPVQTTVLDEAGGHCRDVGQTTDGLPAFLYLQPCPPSVSADLGLDTSTLANGAHHLVVRVLDAAGNSAPVLDRTVTVANPTATPGGPGSPSPPGTGNPGTPPAAQGPASLAAGTLNGTGASPRATLTARWRRTAGTLLTTTFTRRETIVGRLTDPAGAPIAGALLELSATPAFAGAASVWMKGARTRADGTFSIALPDKVSSRAVHISYRAHAGDARPAAERTLKLAVKAPLTLAIAPRTSHRGGTIRFRGRLLAGPIPRGGKSLILEARSGHGAWIQFHVVRSDRRGHYRASYRFKFAGPAKYQFRVVCEGEADYPFATGASPAISVTER